MPSSFPNMHHQKSLVFGNKEIKKSTQQQKKKAIFFFFFFEKQKAMMTMSYKVVVTICS
jgi:hypothetical protein